MKKKSRNRNDRIPLYSEVGKYFSPDGSFNELKFKNNLNELLKNLSEQYQDNDSFIKKADIWISEYLTGIINYLNEKDLSDAALQLIRTAIGETKKFGLKNVSLPVEHLDYFLNSVSHNEALVEKKKSSGDEKREKIFKAALEVFEKEGFRKATMDKIAESAGIGKASVYRSFKNKEDLLDQLMDDKYQEIVSGINSMYANENYGVNKLLEEMVKFWLSYISENYSVYYLIQRESNSEGVSNRIVFSDYIVSHLPMLKERILSLNREKKLKTINFYTALYGIFGFIDGAVLRWVRENMSYDLLDETQEIIEALFYGLFNEKGNE